MKKIIISRKFIILLMICGIVSILTSYIFLFFGYEKIATSLGVFVIYDTLAIMLILGYKSQI